MNGAGHPPAATQDRAALWIIYGISALIFVVVAVLNQLPPSDPVPGYARYLPSLNALINTCCTLLLIAAWVCIRRGRTEAHKRLMIATFVLSSLFLVSYVLYHSFGLETRFPADNPWRPVYLFILISHIILAAVVLPLVLFAFYFALTGRIAKHRRVVRFAFPIWLYVTATGVIVYLMISPYYPF